MRTPELLSDPAYHDEDEARAYLESERWANGRPCPHCGVLGANAPVGARQWGRAGITALHAKTSSRCARAPSWGARIFRCINGCWPSAS